MKSFICSALLLVRLETALFGQPAIVTQPSNQTASLFADAKFRVSVTGNPAFSYQWRFSDADLTDKTNATLTVANVQRTNAGNYSVVVTNLSGSITSQVATLTITPFNSMYEFGFSWTDTQGIAHGCPRPTQCPTCYWQGRISNGPMWPEFLSTNLGLPYVVANNYAVCSSSSPDIRDQIYNFPAPPKPQLSLYCMWAAGPPDCCSLSDAVRAVTNEVVGAQFFQASLLNNSNSISRLYAKGARTILVEQEFDWSKHPLEIAAWPGDPALLPKYGEYLAGFNAAVVKMLTTYSKSRPDLRILYVDMWSEFNKVLSNPALYGFTVVNIDALHDPALTDKSLNGPGADYLTWDDATHPTSKFHKLIADWHLKVLTNSVLEELDATIANGSPTIRMNRLQIGRDYTLQTSSDLNQWQDIQTFTAVAGTNQWTASSIGATSAFYRLKWQL
ncbi:MAG: immunoglobulin domain-containing protein [Verrucomicrobia bacterium]|nr:immunoglobulin domain-containing protein [Verrucomicrobiota bacterium]